MDDRAVIAAIAAGNPEGIAAAYDRYAEQLFSYCKWMLDRPADAIAALSDTFVTAASAIADISEGAALRPWLYAVARQECQQRLRARTSPRGGQPDPVGRPPGRNELPDVRGDFEPAEMLALIGGILAELPSREREVIELSLRHDLHDADLAEVLGMSWSRVHALNERARGRLEKALGALLIARTGRAVCPDLGTLLADWDGRLTNEARDMIAGHVEHCQTCAARRPGALRLAVLSGLMPPSPLPPALRAQVLQRCSAAIPEAAGASGRSARRAETKPAEQAPKVTGRGRRAGAGDSRRRRTVGLILAAWFALLFATSITLYAFAGSHSSRAADARPSVSASSSGPATVAIPTAPARLPSSRAAGKRSRKARQSSSPAPTLFESPSAFAEPSLSPSPKPSRSPSPTPSRSPSKSASPSPSRTASPSPSASGSGSPSPSAS
jgi:RNA polymerase sigma factor (sigma-70 family)